MWAEQAPAIFGKLTQHLSRSRQVAGVAIQGHTDMLPQGAALL